jgi:hypothetical protein
MALFSEPSPTRRFSLGIYGFLDSLLATIAALYTEIGLAQSSRALFLYKGPKSILIAAQCLLALVRGLLFILLPRRPDIFRNSKLVDRQYTVSLLGRASFSWAYKVLKVITHNRNIELDDLPVVDNATRSVNLRARLEQVKGSHKLWKALLIIHSRTMIIQHSLAIIEAFAGFTPHVALLEILRALEAREAGSEVQWQCWAWVFALGVLMMLLSSINTSLFWLVSSKLAIPIHEQLAAVIFAKSMRKKDIKLTKKASEPMVKSPSGSNPAETSRASFLYNSD